jgi:hypothetical protein
MARVDHPMRRHRQVALQPEYKACKRGTQQSQRVVWHA